MKKVFVNASPAVRVLSPFAYKDPIKALEKSVEARVTLDGVRVAVSAVTSGIDVKARTGRKFHLYFYATREAKAIGPAARDFLPISAEEFAAYKNDPAFSFALTSAEPAPSPLPLGPEGTEAEEIADALAEVARFEEVTPEVAAEVEATVRAERDAAKPNRKAKR